jgi:hypothetical protein
VQLIAFSQSNSSALAKTHLLLTTWMVRRKPGSCPREQRLEGRRRQASERLCLTRELFGGVDGFLGNFDEVDGFAGAGEPNAEANAVLTGQACDALRAGTLLALLTEVGNQRAVGDAARRGVVVRRRGLRVLVRAGGAAPAY